MDSKSTCDNVDLMESRFGDTDLLDNKLYSTSIQTHSESEVVYLNLFHSLKPEIDVMAFLSLIKARD